MITDVAVEDIAAGPAYRPASMAELSDLVQKAALEAKALYPFGGRTMLDLGLPPSRPGFAVDMRGLAQVIDYPARDMTITVQAGITIAALQEILAREHQRLPIDVPQPERATLGGALATNISGSRRFGFGTLRDYVIGIHAVNDQGQEIKAGGRVVKNVAGYDLCKLFVGSLGTLGIITQVTLKLKPRPENQALLVLPCPVNQVDALLEQMHATRTRPVSLDLLNPVGIRYINQWAGMSASHTNWAVVVGFEDNGPSVAWQTQQLQDEVGAIQGVVVQRGPATEPLWHALAEMPLCAEACLTFKANLLPHAVGTFCRRAAALSEELLLQAHAGNGIVIGHLRGDLTLEQAQAMLKELTTDAVAAQGNLVIHHCPAAWKPSLPVWGVPRGDLALMHAVKAKLDPRGLFNPGRFLAGL